MRIYGNSNEDYLDLAVSARTAAGPAQETDGSAQTTDGAQLQIRLVVAGSEQVKATVLATPGEIQAVADWLENMWDEVPPVPLGASGIAFEFSHREHIGEGYFYITVNGIKKLLIYEQLGTSNTAHAKEIRELL